MPPIDQSALAIDLTALAKQSLVERQFFTDFPSDVLKEVETIKGPALPKPDTRDLRHLLWFSIDNETTQDLDQVTYAERLSAEEMRIYVAIADVDTLVQKGTAIDLYAQHNTVSIYTPTKTFLMLPDQLSYNFSSLRAQEDRLAIVAEVAIGLSGEMLSYQLYPAYVRNQAKLSYAAVEAYLEYQEASDIIQKTPGLTEQLKLHDLISHHIQHYRDQEGALTLEPIELQFDCKSEMTMHVIKKSRSRRIIENFMITANVATASFLQDNHFVSIRRVVESPERWPRIREIAEQSGDMLPQQPDAKALNNFLNQQRQEKPHEFAALSLTIIKLLGSGEYVVEEPGKDYPDHFSLSIKDYTHSTAPNRRYPDLITQRLVKAVCYGQPTPYTADELEQLARHCTDKEDDADKVERKLKKSAMILFISSQINQDFEGVITGASPKGTWVRLLKLPVEGKVVKGFEGLDVGDQVSVRLTHVDMDKGFIDFTRKI